MGVHLIPCATTNGLFPARWAAVPCHATDRSQRLSHYPAVDSGGPAFIAQRTPSGRLVSVHQDTQLACLAQGLCVVVTFNGFDAFNGFSGHSVFNLNMPL